ncbi:MAG: GNAT family N-acetyltransferase, partial [Anaerolineales bacterium]
RWTVNNAAALARKLGQTDIRTFWVVEDDAALIELLRQDGFERRADPMVYFTRSLAGPVPEPVLPEGYSLRYVAGEHEAQKRAAASHGAFGSRLPFDSYWPRYRGFMQSPVYGAERDRVVVAPDGRFAAFCIYWLDPINQVGLFEPVGTHPDFQRQGLGKALLLESLGRVREGGMTSAIVCTNHDNPAAVRLYESVGFQATHRLWLYSKAV